MRRMGWWIALVAAGEVLLLWLGNGALGAPPLREPESWMPWLLTRGTDVAVLALVRVAALWAGGYLLAVLAVGTAARALRWRPLLHLGDAVTLPSLRRLLDRAMGMAAAGSVVAASYAGVAPPAAADGHQRPPPTAPGPPITLRGLAGPRPDRAPTTTTTVPVPPALAPPIDATAPPPLATTPPSPDAPAPPEPTPAPAPPAERVSPGPATPVLPSEPAPAGGTWTVQRGDSFWAVARHVLADAWGRPPSAREIDPYWRALVAANRSRLADAGNPDLLFPGQVLAVPPPPAQAA